MDNNTNDNQEWAVNTLDYLFATDVPAEAAVTEVLADRPREALEALVVELVKVGQQLVAELWAVD